MPHPPMARLYTMTHVINHALRLAHTCSNQTHFVSTFPWPHPYQCCSDNQIDSSQSTKGTLKHVVVRCYTHIHFGVACHTRLTNTHMSRRRSLTHYIHPSEQKNKKRRGEEEEEKEEETHYLRCLICYIKELCV